MVLTQHKLRCHAIRSPKKTLNHSQIRSVIEVESLVNAVLTSLLPLKTLKGAVSRVKMDQVIEKFQYAASVCFPFNNIKRHLDCDKKRFPFLPSSSPFISLFCSRPKFPMNLCGNACYPGYMVIPFSFLLFCFFVSTVVLFLF